MATQPSNIHSLRVTAALRVRDNRMGQPTSVPYFPFRKHPSNWPASLIAKYFNIKNICIHDQSKAIHTVLRQGTAGDVCLNFVSTALKLLPIPLSYRNIDDYSIPDFILLDLIY